MLITDTLLEYECVNVHGVIKSLLEKLTYNNTTIRYKQCISSQNDD